MLPNVDSRRPRAVLLCHHDSPLDRDLLARWLASWSTLCGIIEIREKGSSIWARTRRERRRSGWIGLLDVLAFRTYYRLRQAPRDAAWMAAMLDNTLPTLPPLPPSLPIIQTADPNSAEIRDQLQTWKPDFGIARIKFLLHRTVYRVPVQGMFVLHPGICPQYRNAHGCFWAIVQRDFGNVGATLLQIDDGIDTGPVYAHLHVPFDAGCESHVVIQHRAVLENLPLVRATLEALCAGRAKPISTAGRQSNIWGHPRLSAYLRGYRRA